MPFRALTRIVTLIVAMVVCSRPAIAHETKTLPRPDGKPAEVRPIQRTP
jgi:hypothetical protein